MALEVVGVLMLRRLGWRWLPELETLEGDVFIPVEEPALWTDFGGRWRRVGVVAAAAAALLLVAARRSSSAAA